MTNPQPIRNCLAKNHDIRQGPEETKADASIPIWACMCILCSAEWYERYKEDEKPVGRCGRCGSQVAYWQADHYPDE